MDAPLVEKVPSDRRLSTHEKKKRKRAEKEKIGAAGFLTRMFSPLSKAPQAAIYRSIVGVLILTNVFCFVLSTYHHMRERTPLIGFGIQTDLNTIFEAVEAFTSWVFLFDFTTHFVTVTHQQKYAPMGPLWGRLAWLLSFDGMLDAFATFPFFIDTYLLHGIMPNLTWVRIFRIFVLFRTSKYAHAMNTVVRVLTVHREILMVTLFMVVFMLLFTSAMLWVAGEGEGDTAYDGLPNAGYDAILMLTGQGGPDPHSMPMKIVTAITAFLSVPFFAVPAAMLTWGFEGEAERLAERQTRRFQRKKTYGEELEHEWSDSESDSDEDTLEEYLARWGGEDSTEEVEEAALDFFKEADPKSSGVDLMSKAKARSLELKRDHEQGQVRVVLRHDALMLLEQVAEADVDDAELTTRLVRFRDCVHGKMGVMSLEDPEPDLKDVMAEIKSLKEMVEAMSNQSWFGSPKSPK